MSKEVKVYKHHNYLVTLFQKKEEIGKVPYDISELKEYKPSVSELLKIGKIPINENNEQRMVDSEKIVRTKILFIMMEYLNSNIKSRGIVQSLAVNSVLDFIIECCPNLEINEIEYIFKTGVSGRYGNLYNDISIDTIIGKNGWIEQYYLNDRKKRPEPTTIVNPNLDNKYSMLIPTGNKDEYGRDLYMREWKERKNPITLEQFFEMNPEYKMKKELTEIFTKAKSGKLTIQDAKKFYTIKGFSDNDFKDDMEFYSKNYFKLLNLKNEATKEIDQLNMYVEMLENTDEIILEGYRKDIAEKKALVSKISIVESIGESKYILEMQKRFVIDNIYKSK